MARYQIAAIAFCSWLAAPADSATEGPSPSSSLTQTEALLVGSSSFNQAFGHIISRELEQRGFKVTRKGVSGAGLARPDYHDMNQVLEALPISANTAAVFVYLGVNDAQSVWLYPHERGASGLDSLPFGAADWNAVYTRRTREFLERICRRGARRAIVLLPVDVNRASLQRRLQHVRDLQMQAAVQTTCAVAVPTGGDSGTFDVAGSAKRLPDGFHMSSLGARVVWERIEPKVNRLLEAVAPHPALGLAAPTVREH